jgi:hypothetical protein
LPIGPLFAAFGSWLKSFRKRILRDSRSQDIKDVKIIGFTDAARLPGPENDAVASAQKKIELNDFESAKKILVDAWINLPQDISSELGYMRLREAFVNLYLARGDHERAHKISTLPTILLDRQVQWIVTHPNQQIGGSELALTEESFEPPK